MSSIATLYTLGSFVVIFIFLRKLKTGKIPKAEWVFLKENRGKRKTYTTRPREYRIQSGLACWAKHHQSWGPVIFFFFFHNIAWNHYFSLRDNDKILPLNWVAKKFNTLLSGQEWPVNILMYNQNFSLVTFSTKWPSSIKTEKSRQGSQDPLVSIFPFHEMLWLQLCILVFQNIFLLPEPPWKKSIRMRLDFTVLSAVLLSEPNANTKFLMKIFHGGANTHFVSL